MNRAAHKLAQMAVDRDWIPYDQLEWCQYVIEKYLGTLSFFTVVLLLALAFGRLPETAAFLLPAYLLRKRIGGWHAPSAVLCQLMSVGLTAVAVLILGPLAERVNPTAILAAGEALSVALLIVHPVYPPQLHFSAEIVGQNHWRKNALTGALMLLQVLAWAFCPSMCAYFFLGLCPVLLGVAAEHMVQSGRCSRRSGFRRSTINISAMGGDEYEEI